MQYAKRAFKNEYVAAVEELAIVTERNRLARDFQDTLGHTMTLVISK